MLRAALTITSHAHTWLAVRQLRRKRRSAVKIQSVVRGWSVRRCLQDSSAAAVTIQVCVHPAPAAAGAAPPKYQGNREARSAIYATAAVPIFDHVFLLFLGGFRSKIVSMAFLGP